MEALPTMHDSFRSSRNIYSHGRYTHPTHPPRRNNTVIGALYTDVLLSEFKNGDERLSWAATCTKPFFDARVSLAYSHIVLLQKQCNLHTSEPVYLHADLGLACLVQRNLYFF
jgi:hypothetical protein